MLQQYQFKVRDKYAGTVLLKETLAAATRPTAFIIISSKPLVGLENGSLYSFYSNGLLPFANTHSVSKIYYNHSTLNLLTGDSQGHILVAYGEVETGFDFNFSYH